MFYIGGSKGAIVQINFIILSSLRNVADVLDRFLSVDWRIETLATEDRSNITAVYSKGRYVH